MRDLNDERKDLTPLFQLIVDHVPAPDCNGSRCQLDAPFTMLATTLEADPYVGRILTGKIESGTVRVGQSVKAINRNGEFIENAKITKIIEHRGIEKISRDTASAGDIVVVAGFSKATVADTLCDTSVNEPIPAMPIDPPTLTMTFFVNTSPLAGKSGKKLTSRMIGERLFKEAETNIALKVEQSENNEAFEVSGRGELQLGILIETMRREGFELSVSRPRVVMIDGENGEKLKLCDITYGQIKKKMLIFVRIFWRDFKCPTQSLLILLSWPVPAANLLLTKLSLIYDICISIVLI